MSTRSEQRLKRGPTDGHLEGLKVRRKQKTLERRKLKAIRRNRMAFRRRITQEAKKALWSWWEGYIDEQIIIALMCDHPPYRQYHHLGWSSKLVLWSVGLNFLRGE